MGCTNDGLGEPVATEASAPFLCDGVPLEGLERLANITGLTADDTDTGSWDSNFRCAAMDGDDAVVQVSAHATGPLGEAPIEDQIAELASLAEAVPIDAQADGGGAGFVLPDRGVPLARWLCEDGTRTDVELFRSPLGDSPSDADRDALTADLSRYLVSLLPWACGDTQPPSATTQD